VDVVPREEDQSEGDHRKGVDRPEVGGDHLEGGDRLEGDHPDQLGGDYLEGVDHMEEPCQQRLAG
jgi:hypothetical protein